MNLDPGKKLEISSYVYYSTRKLDISDLIQIPVNELARLEEASVEAEEAISEEVNDKVHEWEQQAAETVRIRQAMQYLRTIPVSHTANRWTEDRYGRHEMSNKVYKFSWRVYERTRWSSTEQKSVPVAWELSWGVVFNTVENPDMTGHGWQIAGQDRKAFKDKAVMEKYLQGRIKAYAHLFTEISPPIPQDQQKRFYVNGILLPGYTVEDPNALKPNEAVVDELLALLGDDEVNGGSVEPEPQPEEKSPQEIWAKNRKQRTGASQKKSAPAR